MERQKSLPGLQGFQVGTDSPHPPLALILRPSGGLVRDIILILAGSVFVALMAQVSVPLPFTPVPVTGQTLGVALVGALLGSKRGTLALLTYLAEGAAGLPVFAGGARGLDKFAGPTGGYLIGFLVAAFVVGWLCEKGWDRRFLSAVPAFLLGDSMVFLFGLPWLARFVGTEKVFAMGLIPFIPGDIIKVILAALVVTGLWPSVKRKQQ